MIKSALLAFVLVGTLSTVATADSIPELAAKRVIQIMRLVQYRDAGQYSTDLFEIPTGVFTDHAGRHCPMASLIGSSGRTDLVDQVTHDNNRLKLRDVHDGALMDWMLGSGLTQEEIDLVQGAADFTGFPRPNREQVRQQMAARITTAVDKIAKDTGKSLDVAVAGSRAETTKSAPRVGARSTPAVAKTTATR